MILALKYRPKTFASVVGQPHITPVLRAMVAGGEVVPSYVFAGVHGTGKTSTARIFAAALNCPEAVDGDACGQCDSCEAISVGRSGSVLEVDAASTGGVADVERIREICLHVPAGAYRVVIFDEAHSMSREAYNALLKMLEEPPERTVFVLVTTEPGKILKTVRSRSLPFQFRPIPLPDVAQYLWHISQAENFIVEPELCAELSMRSRGHMRDAVMALDQCRLANITSRQAYVEVFDIPDVSVPVLLALAAGDLPTAFMEADRFLAVSADPPLFVGTLTDALVGVLQASAGGPGTDVQKRLASAWGKSVLFAAVRVLWDFADRHKVEADPRSQVRLVISRVAAALEVEFRSGSFDAEAAMRDSGLLG